MLDPGERPIPNHPPNFTPTLGLRFHYWLPWSSADRESPACRGSVELACKAYLHLQLTEGDGLRVPHVSLSDARNAPL